jgi:hypothetical protein
MHSNVFLYPLVWAIRPIRSGLPLLAEVLRQPFHRVLLGRTEVNLTDLRGDSAGAARMMKSAIAVSQPLSENATEQAAVDPYARYGRRCNRRRDSCPRSSVTPRSIPHQNKTRQAHSIMSLLSQMNRIISTIRKRAVVHSIVWSSNMFTCFGKRPLGAGLY